MNTYDLTGTEIHRGKEKYGSVDNSLSNGNGVMELETINYKGHKITIWGTKVYSKGQELPPHGQELEAPFSVSIDGKRVGGGFKDDDDAIFFAKSQVDWK